LLIFPDLGFERREILIGLKPVPTEEAMVVTNEPKCTDTGGGIAGLAPAIGRFGLELHLGLERNAPRFSRPAAEHIRPPVFAVWSRTRLLGECLPTCKSGSDQALSLEIEMNIGLSRSLGRLPRRMSKEAGS
jgi:hypothetical protein